jgi:hypothetical protein
VSAKDFPRVFRLERFKKYCSHSAQGIERAVFLVFGVVSAQSQGLLNLLLRRSLAKNQKSSLRNGYSISLTALNLTFGGRKSSVFAVGGRSSMVEPQIVVLAVAGSSPVGHPILSDSEFAGCRFADNPASRGRSSANIVFFLRLENATCDAVPNGGA